METEAVIRPARDHADYEACVRLQREVWGLSDLEITSAIQLIATVHAGGILLVAESARDGVVGFCYAFAALRGGEPHLHSDMLAVREEARGRGLGVRLKWAQREEAHRRGLPLVTWTFDPLRARNARLNLHHLGAVANEYLPDFYGKTTSALHHGLPTDRLLVRWELDHPAVRRRAAGEWPAPRARSSGLPRLNEVEWRGALPVSSPPRIDLDAPEVALEVPAAWDAVCAADPALASAWQAVVREAFQSAFVRGYLAVDLEMREEAGRPAALYVLRKGG
jgi:predicted GNAT superfamily acetyltransferase